MDEIIGAGNYFVF